jgi:hypothetical protein
MLALGIFVWGFIMFVIGMVVGFLICLTKEKK